MRPAYSTSTTPDEIVLLGDAIAELSQIGLKDKDLPSIGAFRNHCYSGRVPFVRLPSNKLGVRRADLPAIARLYGAPVAASEQTETSAAA